MEFEDTTGKRHLIKVIPSRDINYQPTWFISCTCGYKSTTDETVECDYISDGSRKVRTEWQAKRIAEIHAIRSIRQRYTIK